MTWKEIKDFFNNDLSILGFLTGLGLAFLSLVVVLIFEDALFVLTRFWELTIFLIVYLIFYISAYRTIIPNNKIFRGGFILSGIAIAVWLIISYIKFYLGHDF